MQLLGGTAKAGGSKKRAGNAHDWPTGSFKNSFWQNTGRVGCVNMGTRFRRDCAGMLTECCIPAGPRSKRLGFDNSLMVTD